jgi:hypothetical protein
VVQLFASFAVDDNTADPWTFAVNVLGTSGSATYSWRSVTLEASQARSDRFPLPRYEGSYEHELEAFLRAARDGDRTAVISTMADARAVAELLSNVEQATSKGTGQGSSGRVVIS